MPVVWEKVSVALLIFSTLTAVGHTLKQYLFLLRDTSSLKQMDHVPITGWDQRTCFNMYLCQLVCTWVCMCVYMTIFLFIYSWLVLIIALMVSMTWSRGLKSRQGWTRTHQFVHWWGDASLNHPQHIHPGFVRSWKTWKSHGILKPHFPGLEKFWKSE